MSKATDKKIVILINTNWLLNKYLAASLRKCDLLGYSPQIHVAFGVSPAALSILDCEDPSDGAVTSLRIDPARPWVTPHLILPGEILPPKNCKVYNTLMSQEVGVGQT